MPAVAVLSPWMVAINTWPKAPSLPLLFPPSFLPASLSLSLSLSLALSVQTGQKLNASAEKQTRRNDPAARVMNPANGAYHMPALLVLIAAATSRLGRGETGRWDRLLFPPHTGDSHLLPLHASSSQATPGQRNVCRLIGGETSESGRSLQTRKKCVVKDLSINQPVGPQMQGNILNCDGIKSNMNK